MQFYSITPGIISNDYLTLWFIRQTNELPDVFPTLNDPDKKFSR